jgi:transcriptional regulator with XRE-family HTH domain
MTNKENLLNLVSGEVAETATRNQERIRNRSMLRESQSMALKVLLKLDELGWNQRRLAKEMGVTPQQVNKLVSGKENVTLDTQVKLQELLDIPLLASYYEKQKEQLVEAETIFFGSTEMFTLSKALNSNYKSGIVYKSVFSKYAGFYSPQEAV